MFAEGRLVAFDVETWAVQPGVSIPPLVCGAVAGPPGSPWAKPVLLEPAETLSVFRQLLAGDWIITGANIPFDMLAMALYATRQGVDLMPEIWAKYERHEVFDILVAEKLHAIAEGTLGKDPKTGGPLFTPEGKITDDYSLYTVCKLVLGIDNAKANDRYRLSYGALSSIPMESWPETARQYPVDDVVHTRRVAVAQLPRNQNLHDLPLQVDVDFALAIGGAWGFRVDQPRLRQLIADALKVRVEGLKRFKERLEDGSPGPGFVRDDGSGNQAKQKRVVATAYGASDPCSACAGSGKIHKTFSKRDPSRPVGKPVNCKACDASGFDLAAARSVPRADKGGISLSRDSLLESGNEELMDFAHYKEGAKTLTTYAPWLARGLASGSVLPRKPSIEELVAHVESGQPVPLTLRADVLKETGRTSYRGVVQLLPRKGGIRECIRARDGYLFCSTDYEGGELVTHGQNCLWTVKKSKLAEALNADLKPHNMLAALLCGRSYDEYNQLLKTDKKRWGGYRQGSKAANFGFPGGMGALKLVLNKRGDGDITTVAPDGRVYKGLRFCIELGGASRCGVDESGRSILVTEWGKNMRTDEPNRISPTCRRCVEEATTLRKAWMVQWPENVEYFEWVSEQVDAYGYIVQHVSKRVRGGVYFTNAANGLFQSLLADAAKRAARRIQRECTDRSKRSPLYGSRLVTFQHDETFTELRRDGDRWRDAAMRQSVIMVEELQTYCPDLKRAAKALPAVAELWTKGAEPVWDDRGQLQIWYPSDNA